MPKEGLHPWLNTSSVRLSSKTSAKGSKGKESNRKFLTCLILLQGNHS